MADAQPIAHAVLVHGAGGGGWEWNLWRAAFAANGIGADTPDLMPAPAGLAATTFDDYLRQVRAAVSAAPGPCALVGASLGGLLAMCAAAGGADPSALVLINPIPPLPWAARMPPREWPDVVRWGRDARLASTRRALPDADDATALFASRRWRDESGAVLRHAAGGLIVHRPRCRVLCIASQHDEDVPPELTKALAEHWDADFLQSPSPSHVGPLLGREAASLAGQAARWLSAG